MENTGAAGSANGGHQPAQRQQAQAGNAQLWISVFTEADLNEADIIGIHLSPNTTIAELPTHVRALFNVCTVMGRGMLGTDRVLTQWQNGRLPTQTRGLEQNLQRTLLIENELVGMRSRANSIDQASQPFAAIAQGVQNMSTGHAGVNGGGNLSWSAAQCIFGNCERQE